MTKPIAPSAYATEFTRTGKRNAVNRKPYRTVDQKQDARSNAVVVNGRYVSRTPVSYHTSIHTPHN